jgi:fibronectin type III domain protein
MKRAFILFLAISFSSIFLVGCGSQVSQNSATGTGSVAFQAQWLGEAQQTQQDAHALSESPVIRTAPAGVTTVQLTISGSNMATMGPISFAASAGQGIISGVPAGTGRTLLILGLNSSNSVVYQGVSYNITVTANQTSNAGTITLAPVVTGGLTTPWQIAVDSTNIYWTEQGSGTTNGYVKKMAIATGLTTTLASGLSDPVGITIDASFVYWTEYAQGMTGLGSVKKISISGGTPTTIASGISSPWGIAVDGTNVYWTEYLSSGAVMKIIKTSINSTGTILANGLYWPMGIAVDATNVYWAENPSNGGAVKKILIAGGGFPTTLATSTNSPMYVAVDATSVYYTEYGTEDSNGNTIAASGSLKKVSLSAPSYPTTATTLASGLNYAAGIAVDATNVYFTEFGFSVGSVKYVPLNANNTTPTPVTINLPNGTTMPATGLYAPYYVAIDPTDQYIYWTESNSGTIKRALTATSSVTVPSVPSGVAASAGNAQVAVSWTASTGATSYDVYYSTSAAVSTTSNLGSISSTTTSALVSGLTNNTTYYFVVTAVNGAGQSTASSPAASAAPSAVITTPSVPTGVTATAGNAQVTVSWTASTGATSYDVYYSTSAAVSTTSYSGSITAATTSALVSGLTNGTTYYFIVTAVNGSGTSAASSPAASASPSVVTAIPSVPTDVIAIAGNAQVTVSWTASTGASSYKIYYSTSAAVSTASYLGLISTAATSDIVSGLTNSTTYYFIVTAVNGAGASAASSPTASAMPSASILYQISSMDVPSSNYTYATGINSSGQVVGYYLDSSNMQHGFLLSAGTFSTIDYPGAETEWGTQLWGINDSGAIVGGHGPVYIGVAYGFVFSGGVFSSINFSTAPGSALGANAMAINNSGQIVGEYEAASAPTSFCPSCPFPSNPGIAYLDTGGSYTAFIPAGSETSSANGINTAGQIVGVYYNSSGVGFGYMFSGGVFTTLDFPGAVYSLLYKINDNGQMVGQYEDSAGKWHGSMYNGTTFTSVDVPNATGTYAYGINNSGQIVGFWTDSSGKAHGFIATP